MRLSIKFVLLSALLAAVSGCTSGTYEVRLPPPDAFNKDFMKYKVLPGQKVMVVAVDPNGQWVCGYDHGRETLAEAAERAAADCDKAREKYQVLTKAKLFAINDEIVYYNKQP
jgi:hypothetical protein